MRDFYMPRVDGVLMGRVISLSGAPLANAKILIDGIDTTTTNKEGIYFLSDMNE